MTVLLARRLGRRRYQPCLDSMRAFNDARDGASLDELWLTEHLPVFTQGLNGKPHHLLAPGDIPVVRTDRGGQVTYHGPGQAVAYCLLDLKRAGIGIRDLVTGLERSVIDLLASYGVTGHARCGAPGVYVGERKLASLGLRVRRGCCYHGLSLNVAMDLEPFQRINPCGYAGLRMTQLSDLGIGLDMQQAGGELARHIARNLGYTIEFRQSDDLDPSSLYGAD